MKKVILFSSVIGFISIQGCDSDKNKNSETEESSIEQSTAIPEIVNSDSVQQTSGTQTMEFPAGPASGITAVPSSGPAVPAATGPGLNPPHGEPGHRCELAVGAPLNSAPVNNTPSTPMVINLQSNQPSQNITAPAVTSSPGQSQKYQVSPPTVVNPPAPGVTLPRMNPAHGEPGHDCAIPVGAPLKK